MAILIIVHICRHSGSLTPKIDFLILEDFTQGYKKPCICDLKIGRRTTEEDASLFKRMQMKTVDTISTSAQLGFRICGMRVSK